MKIYNTLSRQKEEFIPLSDQETRIYVCGPTVYNFFHIGNARPFVVFDTLRRYLEYRGHNVRFVQNFTDVDDKIINRAEDEGVSAAEISERFIEEYFKDAAALNVKPATVHPKVTENMADIIAFVQGLIERGHAYEQDGDVYFSARSFPGYGKLSRQNIEELEAGARVEPGEKKRDPLDFALWKARKKDSEIAWESPWGMGRPGWHIECSVMSTKYLGPTIDIHAGGQDLTFPHHENEIAQTEAMTGQPFARYWMHNGYITIDNEKMSKSKNNFFTVRDILSQYSGDVIRLFLLSGHYRNPINFSEELMEQASHSLARIQNVLETLDHLAATATVTAMTAEEVVSLDKLNVHREDFIKAMEDDLNTADAITAVFELIREINNLIRDGASKEFADACRDRIKELTGVLGLLEQKKDDDELSEEIRQLISERETARANKDYKRADAIRDQLKELGITLKDTPQGLQVLRDTH
ncbi:MAG TPA: cysteine--tRNA ligase [Clostridiales bacterium]|jgi:cysteinyl-tRNA synthetase|nr:cysteine--tRNA ligase [Clostridiales bacterium]